MSHNIEDLSVIKPLKKDQSEFKTKKDCQANYKVHKLSIHVVWNYYLAVGIIIWQVLLYFILPIGMKMNGFN